MKIIKVKGCIECLYRFSLVKEGHNPTPSFRSWCEYGQYEKRTEVMLLKPILGKKAKILRTGLNNIPSWCPLEDYKEADHEAHA